MIRSTVLLLLLGTLGAAVQESLSAADSASGETVSPRLDAIVLALPLDLPGYFDDGQAPGGLYSLEGWVRIGAVRRIDSRADLTGISDPGLQRLFEKLQMLLVAYQKRDVAAVLSLYEPRSRALVEAQLDDPKLRASWLESVAKVRSFEPLLLWKEAGMVRCLMHMEAAGTKTKSVLAVSFDSQLDMTIGELKKPMHTNLFRYFADPTRKPERLLANYDYLQEKTR